MITRKIPHEEQRRKSRTRLSSADLADLRQKVQAASKAGRLVQPRSFVRMHDGSFAVIKRTRGDKQQVVASFLAPHMTPYGEDVTRQVLGKVREKIAQLLGSYHADLI